MQKMMLQYSSLGRVFDPLRYPTHRLIMILTPAAGVAAGLIRLVGSGDLGAAILAGFFMGASVFLTWLIARELDPEHDRSAFAAVAVVVAGMLIWDFPALDILTLAAFLLLCRLVSRIVGPPPSFADAVIVFIVAMIAGFAGHWPIIAIAGIGFGADALLSDGKRRQWIFAGLSAAALVIAMAVEGVLGPVELTGLWFVMLAIITAIFSMITLAAGNLTVGTDVRGYELDPLRVQVTMVLGMMLALATTFLLGEPAILLLLPLWAVLLGVSLYRIYWLMIRS